MNDFAGRRILICFAFVVAGFLLFYKLDRIGGLHRDEGAFGLYAERILDGLRPIRGFFNDYTSPVHSYFIAGSFMLLGESVWSLRSSGVVFNLLFAFLYYDVNRRLSPRGAVFAIWILISCPFFIIFSRIAGENYALNPFFLFTGIWFFLIAQGASRRMTCLGKVAAGIMFGLGVWNHIVFVPAFAAVSLVYLRFVAFNRGAWRKLALEFVFVGLGIVIAFIPKIYGILALNYPPVTPTALQPYWLPLAALNLIYTLGGDALYARAGTILFSFNYLLPLCLLVAVLILLGKRGRGVECQVIWASMLCLLISFILSWAITPGGLVGSRIWLLPLCFVPMLLANAAALLPARPAVISVSILVAFNLFSVGLNYFYSFSKNGGVVNAMDVGGKIESNQDWIDITPLARRLASEPSALIFIEDFNLHRWQFLMPKEVRPRLHLTSHLENRSYPENSLVVLYRPKGNFAGPSEMKKGDLLLQRRPDLSSPHHDVYEVARFATN